MHDVTIIIFGASGDLARRKLLPALYHLAHTHMLKQYVIVGTARDSISAQEMVASARPYFQHADDTTVAEFALHCTYQQLDFTRPEDFQRLEQYVTALEQQYGLSGNRILYNAASSHFYCAITQHSALSGLARKQQASGPWHRIVYEKPFGHDLQSAHAINQCIAQYFDELQIYRIDHYLTKELVGNIVLVRFTNILFEPLWNNRYIESVQIILNEQEGIGTRGAYYDTYGALKDMMQNHMLEIVALLGMEAPELLTGEHIRTQRAKVLEKVRITDAVVGQYQGYQQEPYVHAQSTTETFAAVQCMIDNARWVGVPFYLKTGKCLQRKESIIHITFKPVHCLLTKNCPSDSNSLTIRLAPDPTFFVTLNAKQPGILHEILPVDMHFSHHYALSISESHAYEVIVQEIMRGEHSIAVRFDEIESAWRCIDALGKDLPLNSYEQGSSGPEAATLFAQKHSIRWRA